MAAHLRGGFSSSPHVRGEALDVALENSAGKYVRREIAVAALRAAKRNRNIHSQRHCLHYPIGPLGYPGGIRVTIRRNCTSDSWMDSRVVITGMGVVSPNGIGRPAFCRAILDGKSGVKRITRFDASAMPVQIAGEVQDFNEFAWITPHERKHVGRVVPLCIAASTEALADAGVHPQDLSLEEKREVGVVVGTG